jgi:hypothetical protein
MEVGPWEFDANRRISPAGPSETFEGVSTVAKKVAKKAVKKAAKKAAPKKAAKKKGSKCGCCCK